MGEAAAWAFVAASSLFVGAWLAIAFRPSSRVTGLVMAFGAGALLSAAAYDLVLEALAHLDALGLALGMLLGALVFFVGDLLISRGGGAGRKRSTGEQAEGSPLAIVLGAALDGIPESLVLGLSIVVGGAVSVSFVVATYLSNLPEAMAATVGLERAGWRKTRIWRLWALVVTISTVSAALGYLVFDSLPSATGAFVEAFAAGAVITMLADTMMPEAFAAGGRLIGLATVMGFVVTLAVSGVS